VASGESQAGKREGESGERRPEGRKDSLNEEVGADVEEGVEKKGRRRKAESRRQKAESRKQKCPIFRDGERRDFSTRTRPFLGVSLSGMRGEGIVNPGTRSPMNLERLSRITVEEGKCGGRPCIRGLRIRVKDVLELLSAGASFEEILEDYPFLEREDILAAIDYAAYQTDHVVLRT